MMQEPSVLPAVIFRIPKIRKPRNRDAVYGYCLRKHSRRTHPESALAVFGTVDDHRFKGLTVLRNAKHGIFIAFVMAVTPRLHGAHKVLAH